MRNNTKGSPSRSRSASNSSAKSRSRSRSSKSRSRSRSRSSEIDGCRLHIADIGEDTRKSDLEKVFSQYGPLKEVWMTNSSPFFGFAVFKDKKAAAAALKEVDGMEVAGSCLHVTYARPRTRGSGRRSYNTSLRCYQCGFTGHFQRDCPEASSGFGGRERRRERGDRDRDRFGRTRSLRQRSDRERDRDRDSRRMRSSRSGRSGDDGRRRRRSGGSSRRR